MTHLHMSELLSKYRGYSELYERAWQSEEVRDVILRLALIVRHYSFGHGDPAVKAACLLRDSEPLENLAIDDPAVLKMRAMIMATYQQ